MNAGACPFQSGEIIEEPRDSGTPAIGAVAAPGPGAGELPTLGVELVARDGLGAAGGFGDAELADVGRETGTSRAACLGEAGGTAVRAEDEEGAGTLGAAGVGAAGFAAAGAGAVTGTLFDAGDAVLPNGQYPDRAMRYTPKPSPTRKRKMRTRVAEIEVERRSLPGSRRYPR